MPDQVGHDIGPPTCHPGLEPGSAFFRSRLLEPLIANIGVVIQ